MVGPFARDDRFRGISMVISTYFLHGDLEGYDVRYVATSCHGSSFRKMLALVKGLIEYIVSIILWRPEIVHIHTASFLSFYRKTICAVLALALGKRVILHIHGAEFRGFIEARSRFARQLVSGLLDRMATIIALSPSWVSYLRTITSNKNIEILPNPVNGKDFLVRDRLESDGEVRVLFMTTLLARKGIYDLLDAVPIVASDCPGVRFVICGSGEIDRCRAVCAERGTSGVVEFSGYVVGAQKLAKYHDAHLFVLPSHFEGLPVSMIEAMFAGLPIVATPVGGIPDIIKEDENGFLVPVGDSDALAGRIIRLVKDPDLRRRIGQTNERKAFEMFDVPVICRELRRIYDDILSRKDD